MAVRNRVIAERVQEAIEHSGLKKQHIAANIGVNYKDFCRWVAGGRPFEIHALVDVSEMLGLPKDHFLKDFLRDCWDAPRDKPQRIKEFLIYTKVEKLNEYTTGMTDLLLESGKQLDILVAAGIDLEKRGLSNDALYFYDMVIDNERNRLAECLALSYYRRFMIVRDWDMDYAFEAATKLGEHVRSLPDDLLFEAYVNITAVFYVLDKWDHLIKYGNEVCGMLEMTKKENARLYAKFMAHLGFAYRKKGLFSEATETEEKCRELGDSQISRWADMNACLTAIEAGQYDKTYELIEFMKKYREDAPNNLDHVLKAFHDQKNYRDMAWVLSLFPKELKCLFEKRDPYHSKKSIRVKCYIAELYFHDNRYTEAMDLLLESLATAKKLRLTNQVNECADIIFKNSKIFTTCVE